ncbi:hypothetical protein [Desulfospira joergensenii]|uniref:hypothetical protein n=1 Tax=Desulfospira joergensenii TaxID=53329 RepID=UPI0003B6B9BA|nr:hypothetical protein [Desulfospira joergensenii]
MNSFSKLDIKTKFCVVIFMSVIFITVVELLHLFYMFLVPKDNFTGIIHYNNYTHHDYLPNALFTNYATGEDNYPPAVVSINSIGIRGPELKQKKSYRVIFLGDSFIQADEVQFEDTFSEKLNEYFGSRVEFISHGISSWSPIVEFSWLYHKGISLKPDEVNIFLCINDFWGDEKYGRQAVFYGEIPICYKSKNQKVSIFNHLKSKLLITSVLKKAEKLFKAEKTGKKSFLKDVIQPYCENDKNDWPLNRKNYYERTLQIVSQINDFLASKNIQLNVFLTPMGYAWKDEIQGIRGLPNYKGLGDRMISQNRLENYMLDDFKKLGVKFYKLESFFSEAKKMNQGVKLFNSADGHWNKNGHEVLVRYFTTFYEGR